MIGQSDDLATLKTLTSTLNDSIKGYRDAAEEVKSDEFRELFINFADQRSRASADLQAEVRRLGGEPDQDGSTMGGLHQAWLGTKLRLALRPSADYLRRCLTATSNDGRMVRLCPIAYNAAD